MKIINHINVMENHYIYSVMLILGAMIYSKPIQAQEPTQTHPAEQQEKKEETKPGFSLESPIVLNETDLDKIDKYIREYIRTNYPDYDITATVLTEDANEHTIKRWVIKKGEERIDLHFDIEAAMIVFREKHKKEIEELAKDVEIIWDDTKKD